MCVRARVTEITKGKFIGSTGQSVNYVDSRVSRNKIFPQASSHCTRGVPAYLHRPYLTRFARDSNEAPSMTPFIKGPGCFDLSCFKALRNFSGTPQKVLRFLGFYLMKKRVETNYQLRKEVSVLYRNLKNIDSQGCPQGIIEFFKLLSKDSKIEVLSNLNLTKILKFYFH